MQLDNLRTLGRSGLLVSPFALGTMTFGNKRWGSADDVSAAIFNHYIDAGGNFIDTADVYSGGRSEELVGEYIASRKLRDKIVLATKYSFNGGNSRKNVYRALEASLQRLGTDYVDLYWMHVWDGITPVEEVLQSFGDLVRSGKIRYFGLSDMPAWYTARATTLAQAYNVPGPIAMQLEYSLIERTIEQEYIDAGRELGLGIVPWSPLAFGFLSGKYQRDERPESGRLDAKTPAFQRLTAQSWQVLDTLKSVSEVAGKPMAQLALAWLAARPQVTSILLGARNLEQLQQNLRALDVQIDPEHMRKLTEASTPRPVSPYAIFSDQIRSSIFGGRSVQGWLKH